MSAAIAAQSEATPANVSSTNAAFTAKEKPIQGEVIAVGPGARDESGKLVPLEVRKGDRVLFGKWSGTEVKIDGQELLIMKESDILGIVEGKASVRAAA